MLRKTFITTALLLLAAASLHAQDSKTAADSVVYISARDLCSTYQVDGRIIGNIVALQPIMDSLQHVQPDAYPIMATWCRQQRIRINRMATSLKNDYNREGDNIWIDSTHCVTDAASFILQLEKTATILAEKAEIFTNLEQQRIEAEQRAAEERARAEAQRIQREKDLRLATLKDTIRSMHKQITNICDAKGISDKVRVKELKDLFYAYLRVYNRYDLVDDATSDSRFAQLEELRGFQSNVIDSVLGADSYSTRIEAFKNTINLRAGKNHTEVAKSYLRVFKKIQIPITFTNISEYDEYTEQLRQIITVQQSYLTAIELRDTIAQNTVKLQQQCSKGHKDIYSSYKDILGELNQVPAYATLPESERFITTLQDFIELQHRYSTVTSRIESIEARGDSLTALCIKEFSDITSAYRELVAANDFVPKFINKASADRYEENLDQFEQLQKAYIDVIGNRRTILTGTNTVVNSKNAPRGLVPGYRQMMKYTDFTPHFTTQKGADDFIKLLYHFVDIQQKFIGIVNDNNTIEANSKQFRNAFKDYANISKAYERLLKTYDIELNIISEADLNTYVRHQQMILEMQERFAWLASSLEKEDYNNRLKKVKEPDKIKLIMAVK